jgi:hypothetical protein
MAERGAGRRHQMTGDRRPGTGQCGLQGDRQRRRFRRRRDKQDRIDAHVPEDQDDRRQAHDARSVIRLDNHR